MLCQAAPGAKRALCGWVLVFCGVENALWICSYPWRGDTLANPYFWADFCLTAVLIALLPVAKKAVET